MMTPRERWMAAIRMEPVDRLPFWPKIGGAYARAQAAPFCDMDADALHAWIGSDRHVGLPGCVRETRSTTSVETAQDNGSMTRRYHTPGGALEAALRFDDASQSWHPVRFPVETEADIRRMTAVFDDVTVAPDPEGIDKARARAAALGQEAVTTDSIGESPLMHWVEHLAGIERAHLLLADHPEAVEALFDAMHRLLLARTEIVAAHSPADILYLVENTSTTLISPAQYRRYCARHIAAYGAVTRRAGKPLVLHMCGHLKALLPDLARVPAEAFEAFTSPTVGNTTLLDGRAACPDTCLVGGTNAALWLRPAAEVIETIRRDLDALPHHRGIVVTSAGVMPPACPPETVKAVCDWVRRYPGRMN
jgi:uroporphyrinogen-III decarboxylase